MDLKNEVFKIIAEEADLPIEKITEKSSLGADLSLDSLSIAEIMVRVMDDLDIQFDSDEFYKEDMGNKCVGDLIAFIEEYK